MKSARTGVPALDRLQMRNARPGQNRRATLDESQEIPGGPRRRFRTLGTLAAPAAMAQETGTETVDITDGWIVQRIFLCASSIFSACAYNDLRDDPDDSANSKHTWYRDGNPGHLLYRYQFISMEASTQSFRLSQFTSTDNEYANLRDQLYDHIYVRRSVRQQQSSNSTCGGIGDIGYYMNELDPGGSMDWGTWNTNNTLNTARKVHFAYAGKGTIVSGGA